MFPDRWKVVRTSGAGQTCTSDTGGPSHIKIIFPFQRVEPGEQLRHASSGGVPGVPASRSTGDTAPGGWCTQGRQGRVQGGQEAVTGGYRVGTA